MPLPDFPPIATDRLLIVPIAEALIDDLAAVNGDPAVTEYLPYATWTSREDGLGWLRRMQVLEGSGTARQLPLTLKDSGRAIGTLLLFKYDEGSRRIEIGYALARAYWAKGLMHEALAAARRFAFDELGCRRLEAEVNPSNAASCNLLVRLGFKLEGRLRERWSAKGRTYDTNLYGLLASDPVPPLRSVASLGR